MPSSDAVDAQTNAPICKLCCSEFNAQNKLPRMLGCGHTFSEKCIKDNLIKTKSLKTGLVKCPICKKKTILTNALEQGFPVNNSILSLVQNDENTTRGKEPFVDKGYQIRDLMDVSRPSASEKSNNLIEGKYKVVDLIDTSRAGIKPGENEPIVKRNYKITELIDGSRPALYEREKNREPVVKGNYRVVDLIQGHRGALETRDKHPVGNGDYMVTDLIQRHRGALETRDKHPVGNGDYMVTDVIRPVKADVVHARYDNYQESTPEKPCCYCLNNRGQPLDNSCHVVCHFCDDLLRQGIPLERKCQSCESPQQNEIEMSESLFQRPKDERIEKEIIERLHPIPGESNVVTTTNTTCASAPVADDGSSCAPTTHALVPGCSSCEATDELADYVKEPEINVEQPCCQSADTSTGMSCATGSSGNEFVGTNTCVADDLTFTQTPFTATRYPTLSSQSPPGYDDISMIHDVDRAPILPFSADVLQCANPERKDSHAMHADIAAGPRAQQLQLLAKFGTYSEIKTQPGGFQAPTRVSLSRNNKVLVVDPINMMIHIFCDGQCVTFFKAKDARGACFVGTDDQFVIATTHGVDLYEANGTFRKSVPLDQAVTAASYKDGFIIVHSKKLSVCNDHRVCVFKTIAGTRKESSLRVEPFHEVKDVAVTNENYIVVLDTGSKQVSVINHDGFQKYAIQLSGDTTIGPLLQPFGVTADSSNNIIISDWGNNRIVAFGSSGKLPWELLKIDTTATSGVPFNNDTSDTHPYGVAVDKSNNRLFVVLKGKQYAEVKMFTL